LGSACATDAHARMATSNDNDADIMGSASTAQDSQTHSRAPTNEFVRFGVAPVRIDLLAGAHPNL